MNASGNWTVTDRTNTSGNRSINSYGFPKVLLTEGPCEMDVSTYVFCRPAKSVKQYEEIFKDLSRNKCGQERGYRFVMCRAEVGESGWVKVLGMVQFEDNTSNATHAEYTLKYLLDPTCEALFFREIQDCNANNAYIWLECGGAGQIFKHGVFVGHWQIENCTHLDADADGQNVMDDMDVIFCK